MKLPVIEPASPIPSAAGAIERAGAEFGKAAEAWSEHALKERKQELELEHQAAVVAVSTAAHDVEETVKSQPYVPLAEAKAWFGDNLPEGAVGTRQILKDGKEITVDEPVVPMHKLADALYKQRMGEAVENAARGISGDTYQKKFRTFAAGVVESKRGDILDWRRAQAAADYEVRTLAHFEMMKRNRDWEGAQGFLMNADQLPPAVRERALESIPREKAHAEISDAFNSGSREVIEQTMDRVRRGDYSKLFNTAEEDAFTHAGTAQLSRIDTAEERAKKRRGDEAEQIALGFLNRAHADSLKTGRPMSEYNLVPTLMSIRNLRGEDLKSMIEYSQKGGQVQDDPDVLNDMYTRLRNDHQGTPGPTLSGMSPGEIGAARYRLSRETHAKFYNEWAKLQENQGRVDKTGARVHTILSEQLRDDDSYGMKDKPALRARSVEEVYLRLQPDIAAAAKRGEPVPVDRVLQELANYAKRRTGWSLNKSPGSQLESIPAAAAASIFRSMEAGRSTGAPPTSVEVQKYWDAMDTHKDGAKEVYRKIFPDDELHPFTNEDWGRLVALDANPKNRENAENAVKMLAMQGKPLKGYTPEQKRFLMYLMDPRFVAQDDVAQAQRALEEETRKATIEELNRLAEARKADEAAIARGKDAAARAARSSAQLQADEEAKKAAAARVKNLREAF